MFDNFLWGAFPWLAIAAFIVGIFWRWRSDQFGWTTHSSQIYESKLLRLSSPLFHWGMVFVIIGHLMGLAFPKSWTRAVGINDHAYHLLATIPGSIAALAVLLGFAGLLYRRLKNRSVFLSTSTSDKVMYVFLALALISGSFATFTLQLFDVAGTGGYDYRETISPWLRQLLIFNISRSSWPMPRGSSRSMSSRASPSSRYGLSPASCMPSLHRLVTSPARTWSTAPAIIAPPRCVLIPRGSPSAPTASNSRAKLRDTEPN